MKKNSNDNSTIWMPLGVCFGTSLGIIFGLIFDNVVMGLCYGPSAGLLFGAVMYGISGSNDKSE